MLALPKQTKFFENAFKHYSFSNRFWMPVYVPDYYPKAMKIIHHENAKYFNMMDIFNVNNKVFYKHILLLKKTFASCLYFANVFGY